jgi:hypothetical protein
MKANIIIKYLVVLLSIMIGVSCQKGDNYFSNYSSESKVYDGTIYDYLKNQKGTFDSLVLVLERLPDLRRKLQNEDSTLTLFAVNNRSFELAIKSLNTTRALTKKEPLFLEDVGLVDLDSFTNRYVLDQTYNTSDIAPFIDGVTVVSTKNNYNMHIQYKVLNASGYYQGGEQQIIFSDTNRSIFQRYWQRINTISVNIKTKNGVIHILSPGHDFGFGKFTSKYSTL